jgi:hypothetical protein
MRKSSLRWAFLLLLPVFAYIACQKDYRPGFPLNPTDPTSEKVTASISGRVFNERQEPVEGARVTAGNSTVNTDFNGYFSLENVTVAANAAYIKVQMQGYFLGSRTIMAQEDGAHYIQVELIPTSTTGEFAATAGGTVSFPNGGSAIFSANAIVRQADGSAYAGRVEVSQSFIDPTSEGYTSRMPGDMKGISTGNEMSALKSYGIMAIQMRGETGELLQVAPGKKVDMRFPIPAALNASAPATIQLWSFDEEKGLWREEGSATKTGSEYIGQVSHFSFWGATSPIDFTEIEFVIKSPAGQPQANLYVEIKNKSDYTKAFSFSDAEGRVKGWIPANQALQLLINDRCGTYSHMQDLGPYTSPVDLGTITLDASVTTGYSISTIVTDCADQPITNGYLNVLFRYDNHRFQLNGQPMNITFQGCDNQPDSAQVTIYDAEQDIYVTKWAWLQPGSNDLGALQLCEGQQAEFFKIEIGPKKFEYLSPGDMLFIDVKTDITLNGYRSTEYGGASLLFLSKAGGQPYTTPLKEFKIVAGGDANYSSNANGTVIITKNGQAGEFVEGTFSSQVYDSLTNTTNIPMTGSFRKKRK